METGVLGREEPEPIQAGMRGEHYEANRAAMELFFAEPRLYDRLLVHCKRLWQHGCQRWAAGVFWDRSVEPEDLASEAVLGACSGHRKLTATSGDEVVRQLAKIAETNLLNIQRRAKAHARHAVVGPAPEGDRPADGTFYVDPALPSGEDEIIGRESFIAALADDAEVLSYYLMRLKHGSDRKAIAREMGITDSNANAIHRRFARRVASIPGFEEYGNDTEGNP